MEMAFWSKSHAVKLFSLWIGSKKENDGNERKKKYGFHGAKSNFLCGFLRAAFGFILFSLIRHLCVSCCQPTKIRDGECGGAGGHKRIKERSGEGKPFEKHLIHWAFSVHTCLNQTRCWYLETPALQRELLRPCLVSNSLPPPPPPLLLHLSLSLSLRLSLRSLPPLLHSLAIKPPHTPPLLSLQIVSKACLCSISAKASPVIGQLQRNQLQAF